MTIGFYERRLGKNLERTIKKIRNEENDWDQTVEIPLQKDRWKKLLAMKLQKQSKK